MKFPLMSKRKADSISNGVFLILLGFLFYTGSWWPGILFAIGATFAIRQYLTGRRFDFLVTLAVIGVLEFIILAGMTFSLLFPLAFIALGLYLILREYFFYNGIRSNPKQSHSKEESQDH